MERQGKLYFISWDILLLIRIEGNLVFCLFADRYVCQYLDEYFHLSVFLLIISLSMRMSACLSIDSYVRHSISITVLPTCLLLYCLFIIVHYVSPYTVRLSANIYVLHSYIIRSLPAVWLSFTVYYTFAIHMLAGCYLYIIYSLFVHWLFICTRFVYCSYVIHSLNVGVFIHCLFSWCRLSFGPSHHWWIFQSVHLFVSRCIHHFICPSKRYVHPPVNVSVETSI